MGEMAKVLIAEDEAGVREFVARALQLAGHQVTTADDGLTALEALDGNSFDLLLTDIVMPGMDGIALALKVADTWPQTRILLMSGYAAERQRAHNLEALVHRVVAKPFSLREISSAVSETLARPASPATMCRSA